ncbi:hypothetical protein RV00_GL000367 [Enterococcus devriesei]|uniref:Uncharacterized protein n=1 Tax=Enterococcus devriesei TaxID=319970 RepID=A0A1L8SZE9_9ENTE|nr:hypothetical protein RV00_GL000367 [Enterococcus devriesei]
MNFFKKRKSSIDSHFAYHFSNPAKARSKTDSSFLYKNELFQKAKKFD